MSDTSAPIRVRPAALGHRIPKMDYCDNEWGILIGAQQSGDLAPEVRPFKKSTRKWVLDFTPDSFTLCDKCVDAFRNGKPMPTADEILDGSWDADESGLI